MTNRFSFACSVLQQAETDTEKLAALLVVGRTCQEVELTEDNKRTLLKLIDVKFLLKLLFDLKATLDDGSQNYQDKTFCIDIVAVFFKEIIEVGEEVWIQCLETLGQISLKLLEKKENTSYDDVVIGNIFACFDILNCIVKESKINNDKITTFLMKNYLNFLIEEKSDQTKHNQIDRIFQLITNFSLTLTDDQWNCFLTNLSDRFHQDQTVVKFKICSLLKQIISADVNRKIVINQNWLKNTRDSLFTIFRNKLSQNIRFDALSLCLQLSIKCNHVDWIKLQGWEEINSKFFLLLLRLVCIEVQMATMEHLNDSTAVQPTHTLCTVLLLLEFLIEGFGDNVDIDQDGGVMISSEEIVSSISTITETMAKVIEFVRELYRQGEDRLLNCDSNPSYECLVLAVHLICSYIKEENSFLKGEITELIPIIEKVYSKIQKDERYNNTKDMIELAFEILQHNQ